MHVGDDGLPRAKTQEEKLAMGLAVTGALAFLYGHSQKNKQLKTYGMVGALGGLVAMFVFRPKQPDAAPTIAMGKKLYQQTGAKDVAEAAAKSVKSTFDPIASMFGK